LNKKELALTLMVVGTIMVVASLAFPWWYLSIEKEGVINEKEVETFYLDRGEYDGGDEELDYVYNSDDDPYKHPSEVMQRTMALVYIAAGLAAAATVILFLKFKGKAIMDLRWMMFLMLFTVLLSLVVPMYFMAAFPKSWEYEYERAQDDKIDSPYKEKFEVEEIPMFHDKFSGTVEHEFGTEENRTDETIEWGGGIGWYLCVLGAVAMLASIFIQYAYRFEVFGIQASPYESGEAVAEVEIVED